MKVFFDNCTSPVLASTLHGFIRHRRHEAAHIMDLPCGRHASDEEWIEYLANTRQDWLVITGDHRIGRNRAEKVAFRQAGLKGIALAPAYQKIPMHHQASFLLWRWPDVEDLATRQTGPFLFELPANRASRIRQALL